MTARNPENLQCLIKQRLSRRQLFRVGSEVALAGMLTGCSDVAGRAALPFTPIAPSAADTVVVPAGYRAEVIARWGDALFSDTPPLDAAAVADGSLLRPGAARAQLRQFGYNCDGMGVFRIGPDRIVVCVNNEFPSPALMFPGWLSAARERRLAEFVGANPECVNVMQAAVGLSIVELVRESGRWALVRDSRFNRRVTAATPMTVTGPAAGHRLLANESGNADTLRGTFGNCAAGTTPWGTYLTAEENIQDYFGNAAAAQFDSQAIGMHARFGLRRGGSAFGWEHADARFDLQRNPNEPFRFGWVVEIDPRNPDDVPRKLTALGRFRHEGATAVIARDGRVAVYMGDDQAFEYFYKFVSRGVYDPSDPSANRDLLADGTLYAARLDADGSGRWLPLVWSPDGPLSPASGFDSQADVLINCRGAADVLQATPLDRPEDVAADARGRVYLACTMNPARGAPPSGAAAARGIDTGADAANPRIENRGGHILEFREAQADAGAEQFEWEILVVAGAARAEQLVALADAPMSTEQVYFAGATDPAGISSFANPDNLAVDSSANLWIVTDGNQPEGNNGCFVCPLDGPFRGQVRQFMAGPVGAEICGCEFTEDEQTLFLTVQHPGAGGSVSEPISTWPDGEGHTARPSLIAIEAQTSGARIGEV